MNGREFMKKMAQAGLSEEDQKMLVDFLRKQKENESRLESQKAERRAQNRRDRVFNAKLALTVILGGIGGIAGGAIGKGMSGSVGALAGGLSGALAGGVGGYLLGDYAGNRKADRMEEEEDRTGVSVFDQNHRNMTRQLNNWYMWDRHGLNGSLYSMLRR